MQVTRSLLGLALNAAAIGQTFIVDAANGPGTNFLDLPTAIAAVPDGAVLLVRPGIYQPFSISSKGLTILGETGVNVTGGVQITNTSLNQAVTLRELTWASTPVGTTLVALSQCAGPVLLERLNQPAGLYPPLSIPATGVSADACAQLTLRECQVECTVFLNNSQAAIESCTIRGEGFLNTYRDGRTALVSFGGSLVLAGPTTLIEGGAGTYGHGVTLHAGNGVFLNASSLRVVDGSIRGGSFSGTFSLGGSAIYPVGWSRVSPRVQLFSSNTLWPQEPADDVMPQLTGIGDAVGGTLRATVDTEVGDLVVLAVGLPGQPTTLTGFQDPFWLDPSAHVFVAIGVQLTTTRVTGTVAVPNVPAFVGLRLNWQAACHGPVTGLQATNPVTTLVR